MLCIHKDSQKWYFRVLLRIPSSDVEMKVMPLSPRTVNANDDGTDSKALSFARADPPGGTVSCPGF